MQRSVCVEVIFADLPFVERIAAVAEAGYPAYEFWRWRNKDLAAMKDATRRAGLAVGGFGLDARGVLVDPATHDQVIQDTQETISVARELGGTAIFVTTGD